MHINITQKNIKIDFFFLKVLEIIRFSSEDSIPWKDFGTFLNVFMFHITMRLNKKSIPYALRLISNQLPSLLCVE